MTLLFQWLAAQHYDILSRLKANCSDKQIAQCPENQAKKSPHGAGKIILEAM